jgi:hypothetical protein
MLTRDSPKDSRSGFTALSALFLAPTTHPSTLDPHPSFLLHQRHAGREFVFDDGPDLVLDLQVTRNFSHRQYFA